MNHSKIAPVLLGLLAVVLWAAIPAFVKIGSTTETLSFLLVLRFAISSLIFAPLALRLWRKRQALPYRWLVAMSVCLGANFYFQGLAMVKLPVSWYLIIFSMNPLVALALMGVKVKRRGWLGVGLAIAGTLLFVDLKDVQTTYGLLPLTYVAIGMLTWVVYTLIARRFQSSHSDLEITALTQYTALAACGTIWFFSGFPVFELSTTTGSAVIALGALTPIAYFGFNACLRAMPRFGIVSQYLEPVFGVLIGALFFHESFSALQALGSVLIVIGSVTTEA